MLAYADCSIIALTNDDPRLCDCNRIIDADAVPLNSDQPDKQREITIKADWKYVAEVHFRLSPSATTLAAQKNSGESHLLPSALMRSIFHPPRA